MIFSYYHITEEQLQAVTDTLGHDHFKPIAWDGKWIVSVPDWYGNVSKDWQYLDFEKHQEYKNSYDEEQKDFSMFMRTVNVEDKKENTKKEESWWVKFKKWFKNLFK